MTNDENNLAGTIAAETLTDANGYFYITDVVPNEDYTLSFSKTGYSFSPDSISVANLNADATLNTTATLLAPTAALVSVSGKVVAGDAAVSNATVVLINPAGETISVRTNSFGNFNFEVPAGQTYVLTARAKGVQFDAQIVTVTDAVSDLLISALP